MIPDDSPDTATLPSAVDVRGRQDRDFWRGRRVFLTGHTGFKGGWLALWLSEIGAEVHGFALPPEHGRGIYTAAAVQDRLARETFADICDRASLEAALRRARPEIVLHLAAQPLVRASYQDPIGTFASNVDGLLHLLEAIRDLPEVKAAVIVTSDKCYENMDWDWPYRETDVLGGHDPYSASKACAEIITSAWRRSFLDPAGVMVASARSGNVIGGGDWAEDRLLPDQMRAWAEKRTIELRNPRATRPWQHVLEPLSGYLRLAQVLVEGPAGGSAERADDPASATAIRDRKASFARAWNFGPNPENSASVQEVIERLNAGRGVSGWKSTSEESLHEAQSLSLDSSLARRHLGWRPRWDLERALKRTVEWYAAQEAGANMTAFTLAQIAEYEAAL